MWITTYMFFLCAYLFWQHTLTGILLRRFIGSNNCPLTTCIIFSEVGDKPAFLPHIAAVSSDRAMMADLYGTKCQCPELWACAVGLEHPESIANAQSSGHARWAVAPSVWLYSKEEQLLLFVAEPNWACWNSGVPWTHCACPEFWACVPSTSMLWMEADARWQPCSQWVKYPAGIHTARLGACGSTVAACWQGGLWVPFPAHVL